MITERIFENSAALASALSGDVAHVISAAIETRGQAFIALSGGKTPARFMEQLAQAQVDWPKVTVTLVDERMVPSADERANARFLRDHLLKGKSAHAQFIPLYEAGGINPLAQDLPNFDAVVLGMGNDGHTASFFPGGDHLAEAMDPNTSRRVTEMTAPGVPEKRLTFTLPVLLSATHLAVHAEGAEKWQVYQRAKGQGEGDGDGAELPVRAILQAKRPLSFYWCP